MDLTHLFKAAVMTAKLRHKGGADKQRILPKSQPASAQRDEFSKQAKDVCQKITSLRNVLVENRNAYMRIGQHLKSAVEMTDEQRDLIDRESEKFFIFYTQHLAQMRADWKRAKRKPQPANHIDAVFDLLNSYLRSVQQIYLDQKKYRVQYELESYRLLKLAAEKKKIPVVLGGRKRFKRTRHSSESERDSDEKDNAHDSDMDLDDDWLKENSDQMEESTTLRRRKNNSMSEAKKDSIGSTTSISSSNLKLSAQSPQKVALDEDMQMAEQENNEDDPEDMQMLEQENKQLYEELQGLSEEVEQIEKNVVDIAQLQDIFSEKVSLQQHNIERIANAVIGATENVKDANEQIKQAIQRNAGLRVWSLFFLLVMSFALLFLDWYYD